MRLLKLFFCLIFFVSNSYAAVMKEIPLKEKIGQMLLIGFKGTKIQASDAIVKAIVAQQIGGVILFDYDFGTKTYDRNIQSPAQLKNLTQQLQSYAMKNATYPLFIGIDYEGGKVNRLKESYGFPATLSAADIHERGEETARQYAKQMAKILQEVGVNINFSPVVDINVNPDNPVIGKLARSFSDDPKEVTKYARIFSAAYKANNILCSYKHFPGHGSSTGDTHSGFVDVTETWKAYELDPYANLLPQSDDCQMVMTAHVVHYKLDSKGYPASLSYEMTTQLLREKLHFNGVVITDDLQMKAITDNYGLADAVRLAINAGADILVFGNQLASMQDPREIVEMIYQDVQTGKISVERIDESYQRIIKLKQQIHMTPIKIDSLLPLAGEGAEGG